MEKKYELISNRVDYVPLGTAVSDIKVYQIRALRDFDDVKKGDLGGYIEDESCLSHEGNCWVYPGSCVFNNGKVTENAKLYKTRLLNGAKVSGNVKLYECNIKYAVILGDYSMTTCNISEQTTINLICDLYGNRIAFAFNNIITTTVNAEYLFIRNDSINIAFSRYNDTIYVVCDKFYGTVDYFEKDLHEIYLPGDRILKEYLAAINLAKVHFRLE